MIETFGKYPSNLQILVDFMEILEKNNCIIMTNFELSLL